MEIPAKAIPHEVEVLLADLERLGYSTAQKSYDRASFGDAVIVLEHDATRIRLVRDRGQWFIEVGAAHDWFSPVIWRAFLEASPPQEEIVPFAVQARWLLEDLGRIEASHDLSKAQLAELDDLRYREAAASLGLPPRG